MPLAGDFKQILFADLLQFYCLSGQTAAVSVRAADERGGETTGTFFIDGGVLVDAVFDGREGSEAVRRAVRRLTQGAFQVQLGARSERRTVHEPWSALVLDELRQRESSGGPPEMKSAAPALAAALGRWPPPPSGAPAAPWGRTAPTPPAGIRVTPTSSSTLSPVGGVAGLQGTPPGSTLQTRGTPAHGTQAVVPSERAGASQSATPREAAAPGQRPGPGSGPHPQASPGGVPRSPTPPPVPMPAGLATRQRGMEPGSGPRPTLPTAPFSRIRRERRPGRWLRWLLPVVIATLAGAVLAWLATHAAKPAPVPVAASVPPPPAPRVVAPPPTPGVSDTEVLFGMAAPFSGASKELGRQMKVGLEVAFALANTAGGVHGRQLRLLTLDDGYEPSRTAEVMRDLAEKRGVFGFVGNVGTPTAVVALPYALGRKMLFFAPFTGAPLLRKDPPDHTVFNYRASYLEETAAIVRYLVEVRRLRPDQIAVFAQNDSYGDAGYQGVLRKLRQLRRDPAAVLKVTYERNTTDVANAVARVLERKGLKAVVMVSTYRAAARFIEQVRTQRPAMLFTNVSFVGSEALAEELVQLGPRFAEGIIVTQVVPLPTSRSTAVLHYQEALARYAPGEKPDFVSLEGYVDGMVLVEGLQRAGRALTTERLVQTLEDIHGLDLGLGATVSYGPSEHQGSHKVWGTVLDRTGNYQSLDLE
ncbi:MAG: ABC transporter substrate-binding protein [Myxococcaceae bacterium]